MHPPPFSPEHRLSDWPDCTMEIRCKCGRASMPAVRLLISRHGDQVIRVLRKRLRCEQCGSVAAQVWLVAGLHRTCHGGPDALNWSVEIKWL